MDRNSNVKISVELADHPQLRKLARALISLAQRQLAEAGAASEPNAEQPEVGDAA